MTVKELIRQLQKTPQDYGVILQCFDDREYIGFKFGDANSVTYCTSQKYVYISEERGIDETAEQMKEQKNE